MSHPFTTNLLRILSLACIALFLISPVHAVASFKFTLEGFLENAIPQSMLEDELKKGLTTSSEPPVLLSMDKSGATMLLKKFADTRDVERGTEYRTASMNFQKAEIALKNSALISVVTADFSPDKSTITFPDAYTKKFENSAVLPSITHIVIDPLRPAPTATPGKTGTVNVTVVEGRTTNIFVFLQYTAQPSPSPAGLLPLPGFDLVIACLAIVSCATMRKLTR